MASSKKAASDQKRAAPLKPEATWPADYRLVVGPDLSYHLVGAEGRRLASIPDKVRNTLAWKRWMEVRENHRQRLKENARQVVGWMVSGQEIPAELLVSFFKDPAWQPLLSGLLCRSAQGNGFLLSAEPGKGLGLGTRELDSVWTLAPTWRVPHPATLEDVSGWRECLAGHGLTQGLPQLLRPVYRPTSEEAPLRRLGRFAGKTLRSAARTSYAFNDRGWETSGGRASRPFTSYSSGGPSLKVTARFTYFDSGDSYGDWDQECETGDLVFLNAGGEAMHIRDVPAAVYSEACLDVEALVTAG